MTKPLGIVRKQLKNIHNENIAAGGALAPRAVALGCFDGFHLGHRDVVSHCLGVVEEDMFLTSTVLTFCSEKLFIPSKENKRIISDRRFDKLLGNVGVDEIIEMPFDEIKGLSPDDFVYEVLHKQLNAKRVCCGYNFRFGKDRAGNADVLKEICGKYDIELVVSGEVKVDGEEVSSTVIRRYLYEGEIEKANRLLGHSYTVDFEVVGGRRLARTIGHPTINQEFSDRFAYPKFGVYAASAMVDGKIMNGVTNVGLRPTVSDSDIEPVSETWIEGFSGDLYGQNVEVALVKFLRPEVKFSSIEELKDAIVEDAQNARSVFISQNKEDPYEDEVKAVIFDFDDTLQDRKIAFTNYSRYFIEKYFPALDENARNQRVDEMVELNYGGHRNYVDYFSQLVSIWKWENSPSVDEIINETKLLFPRYVSLFPEALSVIERLRNKGVKVGVITNGFSTMQNRKLDASGLRPYLDIVTVAGDEGVSKPSAEIFKRTAMRLGTPLQQCVFVGDHPEFDIVGAVRAGMRGVFINNRFEENPFKDTEVEIKKHITEIKTLNEIFGVI